MTLADLTEREAGTKEFRISVKLNDEEVEFIKWMKKEHFYEGKDEKISFNQTLARIFFLQLREDFDTYENEFKNDI